MAKADRNAVARSRVTGENYKQALHWLREHGLGAGLVPDANDPQQQMLEAALLVALTHARHPLAPLDEPESLFGIAKASPAAAGLTVWPTSGIEAEVLARLLPARSPDSTIHGVAGLRWKPAGRFLALAVPEHAGHVLIAATVGHTLEAQRLATEAGLNPLARRAATVEEKSAWLKQTADLRSEAPAWSHAIRRPQLARNAFKNHGLDAPDWLLLSEDTTALARSQKTANLGGRVIHIRAHRGGTGASTVSFHLACGLARAGVDVAVLTEDVRLGWHRPSASDGDGWQTIELPAGTGRLRLALADWLSDSVTEQIAEAHQQGQAVLLDIGSLPAGHLPAPHLTLVVERFSSGDWTRTEITDRRPPRVQTFERLDHLFDEQSRNQHSPERTLLSALDYALVALAEIRIYEGAEDLYDPQDGHDVEQWWGQFLEVLLDPDDVLPAEDSVPLAQWRTDLLDFLDTEARNRYREVWEKIRTLWPDHNRTRNLQRLGTIGDTASELAERLSGFLLGLDDLDPNRAPVPPDVRQTWYEGRLARWLDERFAAHLANDAYHLATSDEERLMGILDVRFPSSIRPDALEADCALDWWWHPHTALWPLDPLLDVDAGPHDPEPGDDLQVARAEFLEAIATEGMRRNPETWPHVELHWAAHHAELIAARRRPFAPDVRRIPALRHAFADRLRRTGTFGKDPAWSAVAARWASGERTDAERVRDYADLVDRRPYPAAASEVADALLNRMRTIGFEPEGVAGVVIMPGPAMDPHLPITQVSEAFALLGGVGVTAMPESHSRRPELEPDAWNDPQVRALQQELATLIRTGTYPRSRSAK